MLYDNDNYKVVVGVSIDYEGPAGERTLYQVINKKTEVVEREDFALPTAIQIANHLDRELKEVLPKPALNLVQH